MSSIDFTIPQPAWELVQQLLSNLASIENTEPKIAIGITVGPAQIHREPAEGYMWHGNNFHPSCLIDVMVAQHELPQSARYDLTPAEVIRQRNRAIFTLPETDVFHIEPVVGTLPCALCAEPWVLA